LRSASEALDHLIWVTTDLEAGVAAMEARLSVRAAFGGSHPGRGTRNAVLSLGAGVYLEILAPDPSQQAPAKPRWLGVDAVGRPRLSAWAAKCADVAGEVAAAARAGVRLGAPIAGGREAPDGSRLTWTVSDPDTVPADGVVPFLIDWGRTPHPSARAPAGARLVALRGEHPGAAAVRTQLRSLGIDMEVSVGAAPALIATIVCPRGEIELR
jgi:hypothetical protein